MAKTSQSRISLMIIRVAMNGPESLMLVELRDALLPKLLSGELRVPEIKNGGAA